MFCIVKQMKAILSFLEEPVKFGRRPYIICKQQKYVEYNKKEKEKRMLVCAGESKCI
jgi:hypothetical protein